MISRRAIQQKAGRWRLPFNLRLVVTLVGVGFVLMLTGTSVGAVSGSGCDLEYLCKASPSTTGALRLSGAAVTPVPVSRHSSLSIGSPPTVGTPSPIPRVLSPDARMTLVKVITGHLDPKSVVASGAGLFFVQNMMYLHTINVYGSNLKLLKVIPDTVELAALGYRRFHGAYRGAPVEAAFTPDGEGVYVSNYSMYGAKPFNHEGSDDCSPSDRIPNSFVYRINLASLTIDEAIEVGAVPKFVAVAPSGKLLLVSNWCSYSESIVDVRTGRELKQILIGAFPRGIAVNPTSTIAYVAVMGSMRIAVIDLSNFTVSWIENVGSAPRHLVISPDGRWLYATINGDGVVDKIDLTSRKVVDRVFTGRAPRSMAISSDGGSLYVANYGSNTVSKVRASDMRVLQILKTNEAPIGITYDALTHRVLVACYSGSIMVFSDQIDKNGERATQHPDALPSFADKGPSSGPNARARARVPRGHPQRPPTHYGRKNVDPTSEPRTRARDYEAGALQCFNGCGGIRRGILHKRLGTSGCAGHGGPGSIRDLLESPRIAIARLGGIAPGVPIGGCDARSLIALQQLRLGLGRSG